ncbi:uncharacterized protein MELLADRAFT_105772 [Melampsora larici-populina 98AG31]|uniref:Uncharacterized protein n=1 Tax=Melampsora larici-populina (strain 98AG31 / pathotype 3-4-7) TaxID=747676 RepID=F4RJ99_MELLP|nr:uncharacterized protein MELLADRAFT_105772 [Melampsora larici-populina 98AG31]EGG07537.1 hypothetical protein MELLADRAFT_105772 [Melampsora larici-populina 98AG31]
MSDPPSVFNLVSVFTSPSLLSGPVPLKAVYKDCAFVLRYAISHEAGAAKILNTTERDETSTSTTKPAEIAGSPEQSELSDPWQYAVAAKKAIPFDQTVDSDQQLINQRLNQTSRASNSSQSSSGPPADLTKDLAPPRITKTFESENIPGTPTPASQASVHEDSIGARITPQETRAKAGMNKMAGQRGQSRRTLTNLAGVQMASTQAPKRANQKATQGRRVEEIKAASCDNSRAQSADGDEEGDSRFIYMRRAASVSVVDSRKDQDQALEVDARKQKPAAEHQPSQDSGVEMSRKRKSARLPSSEAELSSRATHPEGVLDDEETRPAAKDRTQGPAKHGSQQEISMDISDEEGDVTLTALDHDKIEAGVFTPKDPVNVKEGQTKEKKAEDDEEDYDPERTMAIDEAREEYQLEGNQTEFKIIEAYQFNEIPRLYKAPEIAPARQWKPKRKAADNPIGEITFTKYSHAPGPSKKARREAVSSDADENADIGVKSKANVKGKSEAPPPKSTEQVTTSDKEDDPVALAAKRNEKALKAKEAQAKEDVSPVVALNQKMRPRQDVTRLCTWLAYSSFCIFPKNATPTFQNPMLILSLHPSLTELLLKPSKAEKTVVAALDKILSAPGFQWGDGMAANVKNIIRTWHFVESSLDDKPTKEQMYEHTVQMSYLCEDDKMRERIQTCKLSNL